MKQMLSLLLFGVCLQACNEATKKKYNLPELVEPISFFPVTSYIKGQIADMGTYGLAPLKFNLSNGKKDSVWLKAEQFDAVFYPFLHPEIDSTNLIDLYEESKFADQTIDAFTFTYTAKNESDTSLELKRWDVYINTKTNNVQRIFIVKKSGTKEMQLTWQHDEWCSIRTIGKDANGLAVLEKEELIKWK
ncbi:MAG: hypothetical protein WEA59_00680 [Ferruginibacter sp.]